MQLQSYALLNYMLKVMEESDYQRYAEAAVEGVEEDCLKAIERDDLSSFQKNYMRLGYDEAFEAAYKFKATSILEYLFQYCGPSEDHIRRSLRKKEWNLIDAVLKARGYPESVENVVGDLLEKGSFTKAKQLIDRRKAPLRVVRFWVVKAARSPSSKGISYLMPRLKPEDLHLDKALAIALGHKRRSVAKALVEYGVPISHANADRALEAQDTFVADTFLSSSAADPSRLLIPTIQSIASDRMVELLLKHGGEVTCEAFHEVIIRERGLKLMEKMVAKLDEDEREEVLTTAMVIAACRSVPRWNTVLLLSRWGADPDRGLELAVQKRNVVAVRHFLGRGASVTGINVDQATPAIQKLIRAQNSTLWDHLLE